MRTGTLHPAKSGLGLEDDDTDAFDAGAGRILGIVGAKPTELAAKVVPSFAQIPRRPLPAVEPKHWC